MNRIFARRAGAASAALLAFVLVGGALALPAGAKQARGREEQNQGGKSSPPPAREREEEKQQEENRGVIVGGDSGGGVIIVGGQQDPEAQYRGRIVFTSDREDGDWELYLMEGNGGRARRLTKRRGEDRQPRFSPDRRRIAFVAREDDPFRGAAETICVLDVDAPAAVRQLSVRRVGADSDPVWSPDGGRIFFTSDRDGNREIYSMSALDGSDLQRLTTEPGEDGQPCFSPSGKTVLFVSTRGGSPTRRLWKMNPDGTEAQPFPMPQAARLPLAGEGDFSSPAVSPDGQRVAFLYGSGDHNDLYTVRADGSDLRRLTRSAAFNAAPVWSPGGTKITFTSDRDGEYGVYVVGVGVAETGQVKRLTDKRARSGQGDWR